MGFKNDIQATRSDAAAGATAIVEPPVRLRGIIVASDGTGAGTLELSTTSNSGTTLFQADVPSGDVINFGKEKDAVSFSNYLFKNGIFAQAIRYPTVPKDQARIRMSLTAKLEKKQILSCLTILEKSLKKFNVIWLTRYIITAKHWWAHNNSKSYSYS